MAISNADVLLVNLILVGADLVNDAEAVSAFHQEVLAEIATTEGDIGPGLRGRYHEIKKDRITVTWDTTRSVVAREYPGRVDLERFAQVAGAAIRSTDPTGQALAAYGYNIEVVYDVDPSEAAVKYLADRILVQDLFQSGGRELLGGFVRVFFEKNGFHWQAALEPRGLDINTSRVFLSLNMRSSDDEVSFPTEEEILHSVRLLWEEVHDFMNQLDGSNAGG